MRQAPHRAVPAVLAAVVALWPTTALAFGYYPPVPAGRVEVAQPAIGIQLAPSPGDSLSATITVDGTAHPATVGPDGRAFFVPSTPLAPGPHSATVIVTGSGAGGSYAPFVRTLTFVVAPTAIATLPATSLTTLQALHAVNVARARAGLAPVTFDPGLQAAAHAHAAYLAANAELYRPGVSLHTEPSPEAPGFTGGTPVERDAAYGVTGAGEVIAGACSPMTGAAAMDALMDTVFHRLLLLSPRVGTLGAATAEVPCPAAEPNPLVADLGVAVPPPSRAPILYPAPNQAAVPTTFSGEAPSPLPAGASVAGYPITAAFPGDGSATLTSATLSPDGGSPVPLYTLDSTWVDQDPTYAGAALGNAVAVLAKAPLQPETRYTVVLDGTLHPADGGQQAFHLQWSFTTAPAPQVVRQWVQGGELFVQGTDLACPAGGATLFCTPQAYALPWSGPAPRGAVAAPFADADTAPWATTAINVAWALGWVNGTGTGTFSPDTPLTQAQALAMLARSQGAGAAGADWAARAVDWAAAQGVLLPGEALQPDAPATRAQFTAWLARAYGVTAADATPTFTDAADIPAADAGLVAWAQQAGLVHGQPDGAFHPGDPLTRAQAVTMLARMVLPAGQ